ncbi:hypothetical protein BC826DRAFT_1177050 [Russula brevipes]|nr:hypothetical protein BC826DRAFT_1177050 [Russula brevipes]
MAEIPPSEDYAERVTLAVFPIQTLQGGKWVEKRQPLRGVHVGFQFQGTHFDAELFYIVEPFCATDKLAELGNVEDGVIENCDIEAIERRGIDSGDEVFQILANAFEIGIQSKGLLDWAVQPGKWPCLRVKYTQELGFPEGQERQLTGRRNKPG